jgi:hypothetical protein
MAVEGDTLSAGGIILPTRGAGATWQIQSTPADVTARRVSFVRPAPNATLRLSGLAGGSLRLGRRMAAEGAVTPIPLVGSSVTLSLQKSGPSSGSRSS